MEHDSPTKNGAISKEGASATEQGKKKQTSRKKQENKIPKTTKDTDDVVILSKQSDYLVFSKPVYLRSLR